MSAVAAAAIGAAVIGAWSADNAADKTSDAAKKGIKSTTALASQSRQDAVNLFNQGKRSRLLGQNAAFNLIKQNAQKVNQPVIEGNMMAQQAVGQGGIQANNAILGMPVDMSFANNPQQVQADYSGINEAQMPVVDQAYNVQPMLGSAAGSTSAKPEEKNIAGFGGDGPFLSLTDKKRFDLVEIGKNPLGLSDKNYDKIDPKNVTKKVNNKVKKIFGW
jgi:hypothetical protein